MSRKPVSDYLLKVSYLKDPSVTLRFSAATEGCIAERIDALTKEPSTVTSIEVFKRKTVLTRRTTWSVTP